MQIRIYFSDGRRGDIALDGAAWEQAQRDLARYRRSGEPRVRTYPGLGAPPAGAPACWALVFPEIVSMRRVSPPDLEGPAWSVYRSVRRRFRALRSFFRYACGRPACERGDLRARVALPR